MSKTSFSNAMRSTCPIQKPANSLNHEFPMKEDEFPQIIRSLNQLKKGRTRFKKNR